jgi:ParB family chromosome partitioning protein
MTPHESPAKSSGHVPQAVPIVPALAAAGEAEERDIPVAEIDPDDNIRKHFDQGALQALADNIAANGLLKPITVYYDPRTKRYRLIGGERRWRAHQILGRKTIRARVLKQPPDPAKRAELMLIDNDQEDLDDIERGLAYLDYTTRYQCTATALAKKLGKTAVSSVTRPMQLAQQLPPDIHGLIRSGKLPPFAARPLVRLPDDESKRRFAALYVDGKVKTAAELAAAIRAGNNGTAAPASFTCVEGGVKISIVLPAGDLSLAEPALKVLVKDLHDHARKGLAHFREYLVRKAKLAVAQQALSGHVSQQPERSES